MTLDDLVERDEQYARKVQCIGRHFKADFPASYLGLRVRPKTEDIEVTVGVEGVVRRVCFSSVFVHDSPHDGLCKMLDSGRIADLVREGASDEYFVWAGGVELAPQQGRPAPGEKP